MVLLLLVLWQQVGQAGDFQAGGWGCWFAGRRAGPKLCPGLCPANALEGLTPVHPVFIFMLQVWCLVCNSAITVCLGCRCGSVLGALIGCCLAGGSQAARSLTS